MPMMNVGLKTVIVWCVVPLWFIHASVMAAILNQPSSVSVTDFSGQVVTLEKPAQRIIALAPHVTENVFSAGAGDLLVGAVAYSNYPEAAKSIQQVGSAYGFSLETIVNLDPDVVMVWSSGVSPKVVQSLTALGLNLYMDDPRLLKDVAKSIRDIGVLTGRDKSSRQAAAAYTRRLSQLRQRYAHQVPVSAFYQISRYPLMTVNGQHMISDVIRLCGGRNIFADAVVIAPKVNFESVLHLNPDVVVTSVRDDGSHEWREQWLSWEAVVAVKNGHLFSIHPDLLQRPTVRLLQGAEILCDQFNEVRNSRSMMTTQ